MKRFPISLASGSKTDVRTQFGALCYRIVKDKPQILMITSRNSKRWIIPKGWPMHGKTPIECALAEAWEEAGVKGRAHDQCLGLFSYRKEMDKISDLPCVALVYPIKVKTLANDYPEAGQRKRRWMSRKKAAAQVNEPDLSQILRHFDPKLLRS